MVKLKAQGHLADLKLPREKAKNLESPRRIP